MSGFVVLAKAGGAPIDAALLDELRRRLLFRGPDGSAVWSDVSVAMAASILRPELGTSHDDDTVGVQQPLSLDGRRWIVGDARLDGREDLISAARGRGSELNRDGSDLALILHAYRAWGEACLEHLRGDFAFALWDAERRVVFCARDQFGVAPFFYAATDAGIIGGNTLQAIVAHPEVGGDLDERGIADFLMFGFPADRSATVYRGVRRLPPACALRWKERSAGGPQLDTWCYWSLNGEVDARPRPAAEYIERFSALFRRSVRDRLCGRRVATHLSGGLDSSSVTATAHRLLGETGAPFAVQAYTIQYESLARDEEEVFADITSQTLGIERESLGAEKFMQRLPREPPAFLPPEPGIFLDCVAEAEIARRAATSTRLLLQGFGGDPALYPRHRHWLDRLGRGQIVGAVGDVRQARALGVRPPLYLRWLIRRWLGNEPELPPLPAGLSPELARRLNLAARWQEVRGAARDLDQRTGMAATPVWSHLFTWTDPGFSGIGIRCRFPFFDVGLAEFLRTVPPVPWFIDKTLLREAMRGVLPEAVRQRPKTLLPPQAVAGVSFLRSAVAWRRELVQLPELAAYVDPAWIDRALGRPPATAEEWALVDRSVGLAFWLQHRCK